MTELWQGGVGFQNAPITAGGVLVVPSLHSPNYGVDADGVIQGWSLNEDGSADFTDVTIGNESFSIDSDGVASFQNINIVGDQGDIFFNGEPLIDGILADRAQGLQAIAEYDTDTSSTSGTTEMPVLEMSAELTDGRMYRIATTRMHLNGTVKGDEGRIFIRENGSSAPTITSNAVALDVATVGNAGDRSTLEINTIIKCDSTQTPDGFRYYSPGTHRFLLTLARVAGTGTVKLSTSGGANTPITMFLEDLGELLPNTGVITGAGGGSTPDTKQYVTTYNITWGRSYRGGGATCGAANSGFNQNDALYQGRYDSCNDNTRSWIGFDFNQIASDLTGATVKKCEVFLYYKHWYFNNGGTAKIGTHSSTFNGSGETGPTFNEALDDTRRVTVTGCARESGKWVNLGTTIGNEFKSGASKGIVIGPGPDNNLIYYGHAAYGSNTASKWEPKLRVTYVK